MTKELKLPFILLAIFTGIIMAWKTLIGFFSGAGVNFVAILTIMVVLLLLVLQNSVVRRRIMDMFVIAGIITFLEFIAYFPFEFGTSNYKVIEGFLIYQNVITFISILFFAYIAFRFITEYLGKKIGFVEFILGNKSNSGSKVQKEKVNKELENGSLEEKPNKIIEETVDEESEIEDNEELIEESETVESSEE